MNTLKINDSLITDQDQIANHVVSHFTNLFSNENVVHDDGIIDEIIPSLVTENTNKLLTLLPSIDEIHNAVFSMNKDSAPGPDGFGAFFFQTYWSIIKEDVCNEVLEFFTNNWIMPSFNSNTVVLIPKVPNVDSIGQYRPIAMANFKFKILSKILVDRLAQVLPEIISKEQRGFIKGRQIKEGICLTSKAINLLHNKSFGGNLAIKIDITKAFDTIDWNFLLKVLKAFGFNDIFCKWIHTILQSAKLSISINGKQEGYFSCKRGVRQGDPLSPLLFCITEEVLSRGLTKLVNEGKLKLIKGTRTAPIPSHILYADDVMLFCKGTAANMQTLSQFFQRYANASGQIINPQKSTIFSGSISNDRLTHIAENFGFNIGTLPFIYLGVPIFKGKPKSCYFQPIVDKIKVKLASWKASLLTFAGRIQLVKSVVHNMLIYSITIYSWPTSLIKELERYMRNFIWSGDLHNKKLVTVAWKTICIPIDEGGLGIRSLSKLNEAANLKLCWDLMHSDNQWAHFLRSRVLRNNTFIGYHIFSSIWSGIKTQAYHVLNNSTWLIGDGHRINFWNHDWCGTPLVDLFQIPQSLHHNLLSTVNDYIINSQWHVPLELQIAYPSLLHHIIKITIPWRPRDDQLIWKDSPSEKRMAKDHLELSNSPI